MKNNFPFILNVIRRRNDGWWFTLLLLTFIAHGNGQDSTETNSNLSRWINGSMEVSEMYNDNILNYSVTDIAEFNEGMKPAKFPIESVVDAITSVRLRLTIAPPIFSENNETFLRVKFSRWLYRSNGLRTYSLWSGEIRQTFLNRNTISLQFTRLPSYYLRNLYYHRYRIRSRLPSHYTEEWLEKNIYDLGITRKISSRLTAGAEYDFQKAWYNQEFEERSNTSHGITLSTDYRFSRVLKCGLDVGYSWLTAHGRSDISNVAYDSLPDISDRTMHIAVGASFNMKPLIGIPVNLVPRTTYEKQMFLSDKPGDIYHHGRIDNLVRLSLDINVSLFQNVQFSMVYSWEGNRTNLRETNDAGSYNTHQFGTSLGFLW